MYTHRDNIGITLLWLMIVTEGATPPQVCQMGRAEVVYRVPTLLNCTGKEYKEWRVKVEKIKEYKSKAKKGKRGH